MTNSERMPNAKAPIADSLQHIESAFVIRASDLIRHSTLVIRHFPTLNSQTSLALQPWALESVYDRSHPVPSPAGEGQGEGDSSSQLSTLN